MKNPLQWVQEFWHLFGRLLLAISIPLIAFFVLYLGFLFLRDSDAPQVADRRRCHRLGCGWCSRSLLGFQRICRNASRTSGGIASCHLFSSARRWRSSLWYLAIPTLRTFWISLFGRDGPPPGMNMLAGIAKQRFRRAGQLCSRFHRQSDAGGLPQQPCCGSSSAVPLRWHFGLLIAVLADRSKFRARRQVADLPAHGDLICRRQRHLELHLRSPAGGAAPDRRAECHRCRAGRPAACLATMGGHRALEQPVPGRDRGLAADRLCHGAVLRGPQRRSRRKSWKPPASMAPPRSRSSSAS